MRYAVISDIHSNLAAFEAIVNLLEKVDGLWCLGDVVGYGPAPNECIESLLRFPHLWVAGNHDLGAVGKTSLSVFSDDARVALEWTGGKLSRSNLKCLENLSVTLTPTKQVTLVHGSPRDPTWEYLFSSEAADLNFGYFASKIAFIGHTHVPTIFKKVPDSPCQIIPPFEKTFPLAEDARYIINVGSVGQPRDGNPDASFLIFDSDKLIIEYHRVSYHVAETQEKMRKENLPRFLVERLAYGA